MPKMKTKSSAKKRFRVRPGGTVKRGQAFKRHILTKKTTKNNQHGSHRSDAALCWSVIHH
ncbi:MAG: 50S ribosomal protein L35 [Burkholderiales bacterium]|nr:50S ribosomal protein L35 [Burkholderiales bacterium]